MEGLRSRELGREGLGSWTEVDGSWGEGVRVGEPMPVSGMRAGSWGAGFKERGLGAGKLE